jgi:hypothetical protein
MDGGVVKDGRCTRLSTSLPSVSRLSRKCDIFDVSQPHWPARPVTGTALLTLLFMEFYYMHYS